MTSGSVEPAWMVLIKRGFWSNQRSRVREIWTTKELAESRREEILSELGEDKYTEVKVIRINPLLTINGL